MKIHSVPVRRIAAWYLASSAVGILLVVPFRSELMQIVGWRPPLWSSPVSIVIGIALWVVFGFLWVHRPSGVFGR